MDTIDRHIWVAVRILRVFIHSHDFQVRNVFSNIQREHDDVDDRVSLLRI